MAEAVPYRQYDPSLLEPVYPHRSRRLEDLAIELAAKAGQLTQGLHPIVLRSLGDLVRSMNCYYSNLIGGHRTRPIDIERALAQNFSSDPEQRNLQLEAKAHIEVQSLLEQKTKMELDDEQNEWLMSVEQDVIETLRILPLAKQQEVLRFVRSLQPPNAVTQKNLRLELCRKNSARFAQNPPRSRNRVPEASR